MRIVIDDKELIENILIVIGSICDFDRNVMIEMAETVLENINYIPLPKGHGDLISKEQAIDLVEFYQLNPQHFDFVNLIDEIKDEKPIIEADGGEEE